MLSDSSVLYLLLGSTLVRTISHVFTKQNGASVLRKTFCSLRASAFANFLSKQSPFLLTDSVNRFLLSDVSQT
jgi:hypothetical protein